MRAVIIEDEHSNVALLRKQLKNIDDQIEVIAVLDSVEDSILWFNDNSMPDIIFMDIQLSDGISFEILQHVHIDVPIIFVTAFDEYAIQAFKHNSVDYLLKPIDPDDLKKAIEKFKKIYAGTKQHVDIEQIIGYFNTKKKSYKTRFLVKSGTSFKALEIEEISYFYVKNQIVFLHTFKGNSYITDYTLEEIEEKVDPQDFFRVNRQFIVNLKSVLAIHSYFNNRLKVSLSPEAPETVIVSRTKVKEFKEWLGE